VVVGHELLDGAAMKEFQYTAFAQHIVFGAGSLARLGDAVARFGWQRLMLCTSNSAQRNGHAAQVEKALGARLRASYTGVQPHVQDFQVAEALALAEENQVDAIIGLGGGSPIGMAKAVSFALEEKHSGRPARAEYPTEQPLIPVIAIPTTYAGSEMTAMYGITHHSDGTARKGTVSDPKLGPKLVLYDPLLTFDLPPELTASSGINALAHCVEAVYSITRNPLSTAAALSGARMIAEALPRCYREGADHDARSEMQRGAQLAGYSLASAAMGLHHGLCHILGGTAGVPHGIANAIVLPHAMRFNADFCAVELSQIATALNVARDGRDDVSFARAAANRVFELVHEMNLPQRLRDVGVPEQDLPRLAELAAQSRTVQNNPKPIDSLQVETLLRAMW
jgi:maleylacetate reductase